MIKLINSDEVKSFLEDYRTVAIAFSDINSRLAEKSLEILLNLILEEIHLKLTYLEAEELENWQKKNSDKDIFDWLEDLS